MCCWHVCLSPNTDLGDTKQRSEDGVDTQLRVVHALDTRAMKDKRVVFAFCNVID